MVFARREPKTIACNSERVIVIDFNGATCDLDLTKDTLDSLFFSKCK